MEAGEGKRIEIARGHASTHSTEPNTDCSTFLPLSFSFTSFICPYLFQFSDHLSQFLVPPNPVVLCTRIFYHNSNNWSRILNFVRARDRERGFHITFRRQTLTVKEQ